MAAEADSQSSITGTQKVDVHMHDALQGRNAWQAHAYMRTHKQINTIVIFKGLKSKGAEEDKLC